MKKLVDSSIHQNFLPLNMDYFRFHVEFSISENYELAKLFEVRRVKGILKTFCEQNLSYFFSFPIPERRKSTCQPSYTFQLTANEENSFESI